MTVESSSVEQRNHESRKYSQSDSQVSNKWCFLFEDYREGVESRLRRDDLIALENEAFEDALHCTLSLVLTT